MGSYPTAKSDLLLQEATQMIKGAVGAYDDKYGYGTMSCAIYDTAWVSMVTKPIDGQQQWLFPECFRYVLDHQLPDGSWGVNRKAQIDGILNTSAGLLALARHRSAPASERQTQPMDCDLEDRIIRARSSLQAQLMEWDVSKTDHVGFEMIVPAMLQYLDREGFTFDFPSKAPLMGVYSAKMARFKPEFLYSPVRITAVHSLESFIGTIDFDRVAHHKVNGSMLGSPSSTAAYLMHVSQWDDEAEAYLAHVVKTAAGHGSGGVPSAYPSTYFEYSWASRFSPADLPSSEVSQMQNCLARAIEDEKGVIGFAPFFDPDVDDTAKTIYSLGMLGHHVDVQRMLEVFETPTHFRTYPGERDASCSANTNALVALLAQRDVRMYSSQIAKTVRFLAEFWWNADSKIKDKWNTSHLYPTMLLVEALVDLLDKVDKRELDDSILDDTTWSKVYIAIFQACLRALLDQQEDGSWDQSIEESSFAVLILCEARRLFQFFHLRPTIDAAIQRAVDAMTAMTAISSPEDSGAWDHLWIEKVSYTTPLVTKSYTLAALKAAGTPVPKDASMVGISLARLMAKGGSPESAMKQVKLLKKTPLFSEMPEWALSASMLEAKFYEPMLRANRSSIFPRKNMSEDKYFEMIPFTWTACNNRTRTYPSAAFLYEMMTISFLNFQADEYMESVAGPAFDGQLNELHQVIANVMDKAKASLGSDASAMDVAPKSTGEAGYTEEQQEVFTVLSKFAHHVLHADAIVNASLWDRKLVAQELHIFLDAHVQQIRDNQGFKAFLQDREEQKEPADVWGETPETFFRWVRSTSADHTSCPYSFSFVACLLGATMTPRTSPKQTLGTDCFPTPREKYLAAATCRHLATMCRIYNDLGSVARDRDEANVNSADFAEFSGVGGAEERKRVLYQIADYERDCFRDAFDRLSNATTSSTQEQKQIKGAEAAALGERRMKIWGMFCDVTDLYGQIYVIKDIASRVQITA
ncbi:aphidicolan-16beta-ol synthase [Stachybotrys elegans]|uniref:Aphidicolan-16beta-ol synthase n=1 Tax=Stachybotrys elegans TaxID=80388 RepID=A0A8K0SI24_9HYPO|nr:aphidicolan-16beta-ol synthase [Stachybotrys elegans]